MPINFESPQPYDERTSRDYGAALQWNQDFGGLLSAAQAVAGQREAAARLSFAGGGGGGGGGGNPALATYGRAAELEMQGRGLDIAQQNANTQMAEPYLRAQLEAQRFGEQQLLISQEERRRADQLNNALAWVNRQSNLPEEVRQDLTAQIMGKVSPIQSRLRLEQAQQEAQQTRGMMNQMAQQQAMQAANQAFALNQVDNLPLVTDPVTGQQFRLLQKANGEYYDPFAHSRDASGKGDAALAQQKLLHTEQTHYDKAEADHFERYTKALERAHSIVTGWANHKQMDAAGKEMPNQYQDPKVYQEAVRRMMVQLVGTENRDEHMAAFRQRAGERPGGPNRTPFGVDQRPGPRPDDPRVTATPPGFAKLEDATPEQRTNVGLFEKAMHNVQSEKSLSAEQRKMYGDQIEVAKGLYQKYGSVQRMRVQSPEDFGHFMRIQQSLTHLQQMLSAPNTSRDPFGRTSPATDNSPNLQPFSW